MMIRCSKYHLFMKRIFFSLSVSVQFLVEIPLCHSTSHLPIASQERLLREARERFEQRKRFEQRGAAQRHASRDKPKDKAEQRSTPSDQPHWRLADPHRCLDLPRGSSLERIRKQYKKLCLIHHPDKSRDPHATEAFVAITSAYRRLIGKTE